MAAQNETSDNDYLILDSAIDDENDGVDEKRDYMTMPPFETNDLRRRNYAL
jgi:hypothetical protein